ncbi:MAG: hypothetical protein ABI315_02625 [Bacteroidia bacterium]
MKPTLILFGLLSLFSCSPKTYTSTKYFDCPTREFQATTDKQQLIFEVLKRGVVDSIDVPDYHLIKDKNNIYVSKTYYFHNSDETKTTIQEYQFEDSEIPTIIKDVRFCVKPSNQLQKIADKIGDFVFLTFSDIDIKGDVATIQLNTNWQVQSKPQRKAYSSGGGYLLQYKKIKGIWTFEKILMIQIS